MGKGPRPSQAVCLPPILQPTPESPVHPTLEQHAGFTHGIWAVLAFAAPQALFLSWGPRSSPGSPIAPGSRRLDEKVQLPSF